MVRFCGILFSERHHPGYGSEHIKVCYLTQIYFFKVMFKTRAAVFYLFYEARPSGFRPDKTRAASFLNGFKNIPGKA